MSSSVGSLQALIRRVTMGASNRVHANDRKHVPKPKLRPNLGHRIIVNLLLRFDHGSICDANPVTTQTAVHAMQIGDRINTAGFEGEVLSNTPLALRVGVNGLAVVF